MSEELPDMSFDIVVVEREPAALALVSTAAGAVLRRIALQPHPCAVAVRADGRFAYVTHDGPDPETEVGPPGRLVSIVDLAGGTVSGQDLGTFARPRDAAFDAAGRLHLLVGEPATLLRASQPNTGRYEVGLPLGAGTFVRVLPRGGGADALLLDADGARVLLAPTGGEGATRYPVSLPSVTAPHCMALSPDGRWLVVGGRASARLTIVSARALVWYPSLALSAPPADVAFASDGTLHVATADGRLWRGDTARVEPAGAGGIRRFVRGRPEWGLTADALVATTGTAPTVGGLARPVSASALAP
jgi:DNA-binding beta-propeller fold protein YncE